MSQRNEPSASTQDLPSVVDFVNILQGTDSHERFSRGNTLPLIARPFGMTHWAPMTSPNDRSLGPLSWWFHPSHHSLVGLRATHQPSPWMGDYSPLCLMPVTSEGCTPATGGAEGNPSVLSGMAFHPPPPHVTYQKRMSAFPPHRTTFSPDGFSTFLVRWRVAVALTATERCAVVKLTFPPRRTAWILLDDPMAMAPGSHFVTSFTVEGPSRRITGYTTSNSGGVPEGFRGFFAVEADAAIVASATFTDEGEVELGATSGTGQRLGAAICFGESERERVITVKVATSFVSVDQALENLRREVGARSFDDVAQESRAEWERWLGRVQLLARSRRDLATFYTSLYRAILFPRKFYEVNKEGRPFHYSPYSGACHPGVVYTDNGFWDTHRTVYPFLALVYPAQCAEIMQGWVNAAKLGKGWFPKWASPGYRSMMVGTHSDVVVADAHLRGIPFDVELAYTLSRRNALEPGDPGGAYGREGIEDYASLGHVPSDRHEHAVCRTNDYAYDDFGLAQLAKALGKREDHAMLGRRALNYRNVFDASVGFMRGRTAAGAWSEPFDEFSWGGNYVEGSAWQHVFAVPHDPAGLVALFGGAERFCDKLDQMLALQPHFDIGTYWTEIHEMTEMAVERFGQYAHSNQPVHHVLYLFACGQQPWKTEHWTRRVMSELYGPEANGLSGDEDNGEMSCWFLLSSLGIYPLCPGHPSFVFGSPFFERAVVQLESGGSLEILAEGNNDPGNVYVQGIRINGEDITHRSSVLHSELAEGCRLEFRMGSVPNEARHFSDEDLPFSFSREFTS